MLRTKLLAACALFALAAACAPPDGDDQPKTPAAGEKDKIEVTGSRAEAKPDPSDAAGSAEEAPAAEPEPSIAAPPPPPSPILREAKRALRNGPATAAPKAANGGFAALSAPQLQPQPVPGDIDRDRFKEFEANPIKLVVEEAVSTFSIDVDTASYAVARRSLTGGELPASDSVRVEEMINYFDYAYAPPKTREQPFSISTTVLPSPWNPDTQLIHIGLKGYDIDVKQRPKSNLVLLMDVSGSMEDENKLPLAKKALAMLVDQMGPDDRIAIVVYAGAAGAVLEPTSGAEKGKILAALENLSAGGSTAGGEGLRLAYAFAEQNFDKNAINRVILATDGDFNVGVTSDQRLEDFVAEKRKSGVYLSVLGFGEGNYNDALMQTIVQAGNGTAAYIDSLNEARKVLHDEMQSTLFPIANDVKIQVEFNPARVAEYRLIGYETRMLKREDFANDKVDAGEIGAGHEVTAIYEFAAPGSKGRMVEESRYAAAPKPAVGDRGSEFGFLRIRYKLPGEDVSKLIEQPITDAQAVKSIAEANEEVRFAAAVAGYGQLLRKSPYLKGFGFDQVIEMAQAAKGEDAFGYRSEFVQLARAAKTASALSPLDKPGMGGPQ